MEAVLLILALFRASPEENMNDRLMIMTTLQRPEQQAGRPFPVVCKRDGGRKYGTDYEYGDCLCNNFRIHVSSRFTHVYLNRLANNWDLP